MRAGQKVATAWINSEQADEVAKYYTQGHTVDDTSKRFGISKNQVNNLAKLRGLTNGRKFGCLSTEFKESVRVESERKLAARLDLLGFEYCGGYTNKRGKVKIKCRACGDTFERTADFAMRGNVLCRMCEHKRALVRQAERREAHKAETKQIKKQRADAKASALFHFLNDKNHVCSVCGKQFSVAEFMESKGLTLTPTDPKYCSKECEKRLNHRLSKKCKKRRGVSDNHRHRAEKYGCTYDSSVTLAKLIKRDGLRCAICGEMCDQSDRSWSDFAGPMSPSIDHIIPMSKGGGHTWDNVQVAHILCNSLKGNVIE